MGGGDTADIDQSVAVRSAVVVRDPVLVQASAEFAYRDARPGSELAFGAAGQPASAADPARFVIDDGQIPTSTRACGSTIISWDQQRPGGVKRLSGSGGSPDNGIS